MIYTAIMNIIKKGIIMSKTPDKSTDSQIAVCSGCGEPINRNDAYLVSDSYKHLRSECLKEDKRLSHPDIYKKEYSID